MSTVAVRMTAGKVVKSAGTGFVFNDHEVKLAGKGLLSSRRFNLSPSSSSAESEQLSI